MRYVHLVGGPFHGIALSVEDEARAQERVEEWAPALPSRADGRYVVHAVPASGLHAARLEAHWQDVRG